MDITVYDLNPDTMRDLVALGAKTASSTAEIGEKCDIVELVVMNDRQIEEVITGRGQGDGLLAGMKPGGLIIIHSTVSPVTCQRMAAACAERQISVIDAAVSGAEARSVDGTLTLMVGGDAAQVERARPIFSIVGEEMFHMGARRHGTGRQAVQQSHVADQYESCRRSVWRWPAPPALMKIR